MSKPRFTDQFRYPFGYTPAAATDIRRTFARVRLKMKEEAEKQAVSNVKPIRGKK